LYTNIDQTLPNKLHVPMHYKLGDTEQNRTEQNVYFHMCIQWHVFYTLLKNTTI